MTIAVLWFWLYLHVKLEKQATISVFNWIKLCSSLPCAEQKLSSAERERDVYARAEIETEQMRGEREKEREVCARAEYKLNRRREREKDVCARAE